MSANIGFAKLGLLMFIHKSFNADFNAPAGRIALRLLVKERWTIAWTEYKLEKTTWRKVHLHKEHSAHILHIPLGCSLFPVARYFV